MLHGMFHGEEGKGYIGGSNTGMATVNRERTTVDPFAPGALGDPDKFDTLLYPLDLNPENFFPEAICFQVKKRIGLSLDEVIDMASGGMGDTLAGILGGLVAQNMALFPAASSAVYVHGKAADLSVQQEGEIGLLASDLMPHIRNLANE